MPQSESDKTINRIQNDTCLKPPTRWCFLIALHASQSWRGNSGEPDECWWTMQKKTRWNQGPSPFVTSKYMVESTIRNSMQASGSVSCHMKRIMPSTFFYPYLYIPYNILCIYRYTHIDIHVTYYMHAVSCGTISVSHSSRDKTGPPCWAHFRNFKDRRQTWQVFFWVTYWKKVGTYGNIWKHDNWW